MFSPRFLKMSLHRTVHPPIGIMLIGVAVVLLLGCPSWADTRNLRIGVLTPGMTYDPLFHGLQEGLSRLGYVEGKNISFIVEDTQGNITDLASRMEKVLSAKPDALYVVGTAHALAAKQATTTLPVVFSWVGDPVQTRLIAAYSSSKTNLTGVANSSDSLSGKRLEALLTVAPGVRRLLAIIAPKESVSLSSLRFLEETARKLGVQVVRRDATTTEDIKKALQETPKGSVDALYHIPSSHVGAHIGLLIEKARQDKIPLVAHEESIAERGALLTYGPNFRLVGVQSARLMAKILSGERPADIPSETPEKLLLVVNWSTAKAIGLKMPASVQERVDRLVE
jgi:putative ABC transport system substrate-binding protein